MIADSWYVFMNGEREDGEREWFLLFVFDYGVSIGAAQGFGSGDGGHGFEANPNEIVIDRKLGENDLEIFEVEIVRR